MWGKIYKVIYVAAFLFVVGVLVYALFFTEEKDIKLIYKAGTVFAMAILSMFGLKRNGRDRSHSLQFYETLYKDIIGGAFVEDKKSYRQLLQVTRYYNQDQLGRAYKLIDKLLKKCKSSKDYSAVYMFQALCLSAEKKTEATIQAYERLLQYDMANSQAWSNLGLRYMELGKKPEAKNAYSNAILYDPQNAYAYNNMASYYMRMGELQLGLEYAAKAIEIDGMLYQAIGLMAQAYKMLGDEEKVEEYCKMYGASGGNIKKLRTMLAEL
ncbi:MAG: tetratricopeptide repeat protein [Lachnospiraceae bacterium]|nr:tetratricopeptide repeat protein [Lachnospiraceae bacterium]